MSQSSGYQYSVYPEPSNSLKNDPSPIVNGQSSVSQQNGMQSPQYNLTGTPSSQSSRDPSRETSRDPSPTQYLHNQYRPQLPRPPMPPINGPQSSNALPSLPRTTQLYNPINPYGISSQYATSTHSNVAVSTPSTAFVSQPNQEAQYRCTIPSNQMPSLAKNLSSGSAPSTFTDTVEPELAKVNQSYQWTTNPLPTNVMQGTVGISGTSSSIEKTSLVSTDQTVGGQTSFTGVNKTSAHGQSDPTFPSSSNVSLPPSNITQHLNQTRQVQQDPAISSIQSPRIQNIQAQSTIGLSESLNSPQLKYGSQQNIFSPTSTQSNSSTRNLFSSSQGHNVDSRNPQDYCPQPLKPQQNLLTGYMDSTGFGSIPQGQNIHQNLTGQRRYPQQDTANTTMLPPKTTAPPLGVNQLHSARPPLSGMPPLPGQQTYDTRSQHPGPMTNVPLDSLNRRYPNMYPDQLNQLNNQMGNLHVTQSGYNKLWGVESIDLLQCRNILPPEKVEPPKIKLHQEFLDNGPKLPEEFQFDPVTKSYGDPSRRPEVRTGTIEFIAPSEYMVRPPQPAVYLFVMDVSRLAVESGYLQIVCNTITDELSRLPGDSRTQVGFLAVDSALHFFSMPDNVSQPHEMVMLDIDDVFLPCPENLIVNLKEREELIRDLLAQLSVKFCGTHDTNSALGAGLQAALKLLSATGGRVTVFQTCLPNIGPGALQPREDPNTRTNKDVPHLNPATDFYKRFALDCSGQQIAIDLFLLNSQYSDLATLSCMSKFTGGCIYHLPLFRASKLQNTETLERLLRRYLTRKIGFEAVMRLRCTRGLSIHAFHGSFFVRSTDLLCLPNINPDAGFGMQISIDENLSDVQNVCFQASLLYTSSKGERRIRVHTLCLPVVSSLSDVLYSADQQCIVGLLSKMAVDRSLQSSLSDARDALINVAIDVLSAYRLSQSSGAGGLVAPGSLKLLPLYIIALLKSVAFRSGTSTRLDDRVFAMFQLKTLPLAQLIQMVFPDLYPVHALDDRNSKDIDGKVCPQPPRLHLSAEKLDSRGVFLIDSGDRIFIYVGKNINPIFCSNVLGVSAFASIPEEMYELPELDTVESERLRNFVFSLQEEKPYYVPVQIIRDDSHFRTLFIERLIEDRFESALSYYEFLQHLKTQVKE
ncbi:protein transport protein sec24b-like protein [Lasius niger]|uniref:Protein transport protein sec24b-like protein n=1 Tax=Lasius niger TaxID=67767 RepID=A0A0J7P0L4_LASNI|nr:protein transport protein sec24b-like protein [Lasius niger]